MTEAGVDVDKAAFAIAVKIGAHRFKLLNVTQPPKRRVDFGKLALATATDSIVYYIQRGKLIKIGTTADPARRFAELLPDKILAFEPGEPEHEKMRHWQFTHLRRQGEYFTAAPELMEHIRHIRRMYGNPDPSWPTAAGRGEVRRKPPTANGLIPVVDGELVTAAEAVHRLGINAATVSGWVHRKKVKPVKRNDRGHQVYYMEHFETMAKTYKRRTVKPA